MQAHPQAQQLAEAHDKAQAERFVPSPAMWAALVAEIRANRADSVCVVFKDVDLECFGTFTPNSDGYCDNGGFAIDRVEHAGDDIKSLFSADDLVKLSHECYDEFERDAAEQADFDRGQG